jgi:predicted ATPase
MLLDQTARHALDIFHAYGRCFKGMLLIKQGDVEVGLQLLDELRRQDKWPSSTRRFSAAWRKASPPQETLFRASRRSTEALARSELTEERWVTAELLRIRGELLLLDDEPKAAEEHFRQALDWARRQDALSWELRAATSLARLSHRQRRTSHARMLLEPVYGRFTEGFNTADLITAKTLLGALR